MLFWIVAAVMTFAATLALLLPLLGRKRRPVLAPEAYDAEVYRDQLREVDRDLAAGQIDTEEAEVARAEIGRRLIAASRKSSVSTEPNPKDGKRPGASPFAIVAILFAMPIIALTAYLALGTPNAEQQPLMARLNQDPEKADIRVLIANAERHLAADPNDGRGWDVLAPIYLKLGRIEEAETAFRKAIALLGPSAARQAGLGEVLVTQADGVVTEEARLTFQSARELDPEDPRPAFFLAIAKAQEGRRDEARAQFQALIDRAPEDAPWVPAVRQQIAALERSTTMPASENGPTANDIAAAAAGKTPEERQAMISSMVATLENRLAENPDNLDGWLMLIKSKTVLNDAAGAQIALDRALTNFSGRENAARLIGAARQLGLKINADLGGVPVSGNGAGKSQTPPTGSAADSGPFIMPSPQDAGNVSESSDAAGPTREEIAAAEEMTPEDRRDMIRGMVASLDGKLAENPDNLPGWLRLIRSYSVLGDRQAALDALDRARDVFAGRDQELAEIDRLAGELDLIN